MAELDDLLSQIPTDQIASTLGVDTGEVDNAIKTLVPVLVGGLQQNAQDPGNASAIESAANDHAASGLLDGGVSVDQVDQQEGHQAVARIFGGNDTPQVAAALSGAGAGRGDLIQRLLPILAPIVLAYIGKQLTSRGAPAAAGAPAPQAQGAPAGGGLGEVLGGLLGGGGSGGGDLGSILGSVLGDKGGSIGNILGGLLGGKQ